MPESSQSQTVCLEAVPVAPAAAAGSVVETGEPEEPTAAMEVMAELAEVTQALRDAAIREEEQTAARARLDAVKSMVSTADIPPPLRHPLPCLAVFSPCRALGALLIAGVVVCVLGHCRLRTARGGPREGG